MTEKTRKALIEATKDNVLFDREDVKRMPPGTVIMDGVGGVYEYDGEYWYGTGDAHTTETYQLAIPVYVLAHGEDIDVVMYL